MAEKQARRREFLVCIRNAREVDFPTTSRTERRSWSAGSAGLNPRTSIKRACSAGSSRLSEYALIDHPEAWGEWRNPVKYTTLEELGIDLKQLKFKPMPAAQQRPATACHLAAPVKAGALTIAEAKAGLALQFGVPPEAIEILIKG